MIISSWILFLYFFVKTLHVLSIEFALIYIPANSAQDSRLSTASLTLVISGFLFIFDPNRYEVISHSFDFHFPDD